MCDVEIPVIHAIEFGSLRIRELYYLDYSPEQLREIYDEANLTVLE